MDIFTIGKITEVLGLHPERVKLWRRGKPFLFEPSHQEADGKGSRNLYNKQDFYLLGIAHELTKAGFAGVAIGRAIEAFRPKVLRYDHKSVVRFWRTTGGAFGVGPKAPKNRTLVHTIQVGKIFKKIDDATSDE